MPSIGSDLQMYRAAAHAIQVIGVGSSATLSHCIKSCAVHELLADPPTISMPLLLLMQSVSAVGRQLIDSSEDDVYLGRKKNQGPESIK